MIKALYVDDDPDISTIVEMCLDLSGEFEIVCASSGQEALVKAEAWQPDVVLLDYMMPVMDGPTTYLCLKENPATAGIPVAFVTAKSMQSDVSTLLELGAIGVISKPFDPNSLATDVKALLAG
ncbi:response regulator [Roseibium aggregatum]|jgi:CheY-like chemotaxis protein|uniref:response regulator n=1 Tax=Roseibium aggregatum TaxID=187304 RepID=UPI003A97F6F5